MGQFKNHDDPKPILDNGPKPILDSKHIHDNPVIYLKHLKDEMYRKVWPWETVKFDVPDGLLPFFLANPHQYGGAALPAEENKVSPEMYDSMIREAEHQIGNLKAHIDFLGKEKDKLKETAKK